MKFVLLIATMMIALFMYLPTERSEGEDSAASADQPDGKGPLRHVVVFRFKEGTLPLHIEEVERAFEQLPAQIPTIQDFEWGHNNSPEGLNDGFTHCFLVTFADEAGREVYLPHPAHQQFVEILKPHLDKAFVVDYFAR